MTRGRYATLAAMLLVGSAGIGYDPGGPVLAYPTATPAPDPIDREPGAGTRRAQRHEQKRRRRQLKRRGWR